MKKLILSMFMVAICGLAHAGNAVEPSKSVQFASKASVTIKSPKISVGDVECTSTSIPICDNGKAVDYITVTICAANLIEFIQSFDCN